MKRPSVSAGLDRRTTPRPHPPSRRKQERLTSFFGGGADHGDGANSRGGNSIGSIRSSRFGACPLCQRSFPWHVLQPHAEACVGGPSADAAVETSPQPAARPGPVSDAVVADRAAVEATAAAAEAASSAAFSERVLDGSGAPDGRSHAVAPASSDDDGGGGGPSKSKSCGIVDDDALDEAAGPGRSALLDGDGGRSSMARSPLAEAQQRRRSRCAVALKPTSQPLPGLYLYEDFITPEEEAAILAGLDRLDAVPAWKESTFNGRSRGKRWGVHCNLRDRRVDAPEHPLPDFLKEAVLSRLGSLPPMAGCNPNEANAIDYRRKKGHWLKAHVDDRRLSKEPIANLSLGGDCVMTYRPAAAAAAPARLKGAGFAGATNGPDGSCCHRVLLKRRCLQVLTGPARYDCSHGIAHSDLLSDRRVSVTMRESPLTVAASAKASTANANAGRMRSKVGPIYEAWRKQQQQTGTSGTTRNDTMTTHKHTPWEKREEKFPRFELPCIPGRFVAEDLKARSWILGKTIPLTVASSAEQGYLDQTLPLVRRSINGPD